jgi:hypothetical protein
MDDDVADRLDNLDLALTQIADAVEVLAGLVAYDTTSVLDQLERARQLIGTGDDDTGDDGQPAALSFE